MDYWRRSARKSHVTNNEHRNLKNSGGRENSDRFNGENRLGW